MIDVRPRVDWEHGLISNEIFVDEEVFQQELEHVFRRCWLFVGHESSIPNNGDYLTNYMGIDQVIVLRDLKGKLRVFLNPTLRMPIWASWTATIGAWSRCPGWPPTVASFSPAGTRA